MSDEKKTEIAKVRTGLVDKVGLTADFGTLYIKRDVRGNIMKPVKGVMTLSKEKGHLYNILGKDSISARGYVHLNKVAGVSVITPTQVAFDGIMRSNPYVERNPRTKAIETVTIRKVGVGFNPAGNLVVVDKTLFFNIYTYFIQSIQAKMKRRLTEWDNTARVRKDLGPKYPKCAVIGTHEDRPIEKFSRRAKWVFYETEPPLGIWVDYTHEAIIECLEEHTQKQRFGDRIAQTIVQRNILKDHPAIGISQVVADKKTGLATVQVWGWRYHLTMDDIQGFAEVAESSMGGKQINAEVVNPEEKEVEEATAEIVEEAAEEDPVEKEFTPQPNESEPPPEFFEQQKLGVEKKKNGGEGE